MARSNILSKPPIFAILGRADPGFGTDAVRPSEPLILYAKADLRLGLSRLAVLRCRSRDGDVATVAMDLIEAPSSFGLWVL